MKTCPTPEQLCELLNREQDISATNPIAMHIQHCRNCQNLLADMTSGKSFLAVMNTSALTTEAPPELEGYETIRMLGRGGMGIVFLARRLSDDRLVAIKWLATGAGSSSGTGDEKRRERFAREVQAVSSLQHPHIVQVIDSGIVEAREYLVMELLGGGSLVEWQIRRRPVHEVVEIAIKVCRAVQYAHDASVIHRDLKPGNILLTNNGIPKVTDFGLARRLDEPEAYLTLSGEALGTPAFIAPEQVRQARDVAAGADIYSLGAVLYALLTGQPPHSGSDALSCLRKVIEEDPIPPRKLAPEVPRALETICLKCLEKDPRHRYQTSSELADDLQRFRNGRKIVARPPSVVRRVKRSLARLRLPSALALSLSLVALVASLWIWNTYYRIRTEYFANFASVYNLPVGIGPLTPDQVRHRSQSLRFSISRRFPKRPWLASCSYRCRPTGS